LIFQKIILDKSNPPCYTIITEREVERMAKIEIYKWAQAITTTPKRKIWFRFSNKPTVHRFGKDVKRYNNAERN